MFAFFACKGEFKRIIMAEAFRCQLSVNLTREVSSRFHFGVFVDHSSVVSVALHLKVVVLGAALD